MNEKINREESLKKSTNYVMSGIAAFCISIVAGTHLRYVSGIMGFDDFWVNDSPLIIIFLMTGSLTYIFNSLLNK